MPKLLPGWLCGVPNMLPPVYNPGEDCGPNRPPPVLGDSPRVDCPPKLNMLPELWAGVDQLNGEELAAALLWPKAKLLPPPGVVPNRLPLAGCEAAEEKLKALGEDCGAPKAGVWPPKVEAAAELCPKVPKLPVPKGEAPAAAEDWGVLPKAKPPVPPPKAGWEAGVPPNRDGWLCWPKGLAVLAPNAKAGLDAPNAGEDMPKAGVELLPKGAAALCAPQAGVDPGAKLKPAAADDCCPKGLLPAPKDRPGWDWPVTPPGAAKAAPGCAPKTVPPCCSGCCPKAAPPPVLPFTPACQVDQAAYAQWRAQKTSAMLQQKLDVVQHD